MYYKSLKYRYKYFGTDSQFDNKIFIISCLILIFFVLFATLIGVGYQPAYKDISVLPLSNGASNHAIVDDINNLAQPLPQWIRTIRGLGLFFLGWYAFFGLQSIIYSLKLFKQQSIIKATFIYLNFIPLISISLIIALAIKTHLISFKDYVRSWFDRNEIYYGLSYRRDIKYWACVVLLIITTPILWFSLFRNPNLNTISLSVGYETNLWFDSLQYFTIQTNLLCFIALLAYVIYPEWKIFKNKNIFIVLASYITIVCLVFNIGIIPFNVDKYANQPYKIARTVFEHGINPVCFVASFIIIMTKDKQMDSYNKMNLYGLVVPAIYGIYALLSPLMCGTSVYGFITNTNPLLIINGHHGHYELLLVYFAFAILFSLFNLLYWWINKRIYEYAPYYR